MRSAPLFTTTALSTALMLATAPTALADLTAQEVWESYKKSLGVYGESQVNVGSETFSGDTLTVTDIEMIFEDDEVSASTLLNELQLREMGDGRVALTFSPETSFTIEGDEFSADLSLNIPNTEIIVSGDAEKQTFQFENMTQELVVNDITIQGEPLDQDITFFLSGLTGSYTNTEGPMFNTDYDITATDMAIRARAVIPEIDGEPGGLFDITSNIVDLAAKGTVEMPRDFDEIDAAELLGQTRYTIDYAVGPGQSTFQIVSVDANMSGKSSSEGGAFLVKFAPEGVVYDVSGKGMSGTLQDANFPFPIDYSADAIGFNIEVPVSKADEPQPFSFDVSVVELAIGDFVWNLFDANQQLPRDPVTLTWDIDGTANPNVNLFDPMSIQAAAMGGNPGEINSLSLKSLLFNGLGAKLTGAGNFTFDNTKMTLPGVPQPTGEATFNATGILGLMDKLGAMGLLPPEQIMGARMMMPMFATTIGPDELESKIEATPEGSIFINGMQIQ